MKSMMAAMASAAAILAGCGGGGSDPPAQASPDPQTQVRAVPQMQEGLYLGGSLDTLDFSERAGSVLVLENQEVWALLQTTGLLNRPTQFGEGTFRSTGPDPALFTDSKAVVAFASSTLSEITMTLTASTVANIPILSVAPPPTPRGSPLSGGLTSPAIHDYNSPARISDVVGAWRPSFVDSSFTIDGAGTIAATTPPGTCSFTGSLTPRPSGKNVFNVTLTVTGCADAGSYTGVGVSYLDRDNRVGGGPFTTPTLRLMGIDQSRTKVFAKQVQR